jgi:hypothetical protein
MLTLNVYRRNVIRLYLDIHILKFDLCDLEK